MTMLLTASSETRSCNLKAASFDGIVIATRGTAARVGEISDLTEKQRRSAEDVIFSLEQISTIFSLEQISTIAKRNAAGTEEASAATCEQTVTMQKMAESADALTRTSQRLQDLIAIFKLC